MEENEEITLFGIRGKMQCGKDEVGKMIQYLTSDHGINGTRGYLESRGKCDSNGYGYNNFVRYSSPWVIKRFANSLKDVISMILVCSRNQLEDDKFKNTVVGEEWWYYSYGDGAVMVPYLESKHDKEDDVFMDRYLVKPTPRTMIQHLGTDLMRKQLHPNVWVNTTFSTYVKNIGYADGNYTNKCGQCYSEFIGDKRAVRCKDCSEFYDKWVLTDVRFNNEVDAIESRGGIMINVVRPFALRYPEYAKYGDGLNFTDDLKKFHPEFHAKLTHISEIELDYRKFKYTIVNDGTVEDLLLKVDEILTKENLK